MDTKMYQGDDFQDFCLQVEADVQKMQPQAHLRRVMKNNQVEMTGLDFSDKPGRVTPIIYLEPFFKDYQNGQSHKEILANIMKVYHQRDDQMEVRLQYALKWSFAKHRILYKLINAERNRELLQRIPHERWLDLALVYYYPVRRSKEACANITVTDQLLERWQVTAKDLFFWGTKNVTERLQVRALPITEMLKGPEEESMKEPFDVQSKENGEKEGMSAIPSPLIRLRPREEEHMYVITNQFQMFGAIGILNDEVLHCLAEHLQDDLYILPSSIHECIIVPQAREEIQQIKALVYEMNRTNVEPVELLSDSIYVYHREKRAIEEL